MAEPRTITIPGAPEGFNCRLTAGGWGKFVCRVLEISYTLNVIANEDAAANRKAFYPWLVSGSSFTLMLVHKNEEERDQFNRWMQGYMTALAANHRVSGSIKVEVPARRFVRIGVVEGTLEFGAVWNHTLTHATALGFVGASDPLSAVGGKSVGGISYYKAARNDAKMSATFYPSGSQISGAESLEGTIFDTTPPAVADLVPNIPTEVIEKRLERFD